MRGAPSAPDARVSADDFVNTLRTVAKRDLREIFGADLFVSRNGTAFVPQHRGIASLGVLTPRPVELSERDGSMRVRFEDTHGNMDLSLTDIRFYDRSGRLRQPTVGLVERRLAKGQVPYLAVGLTRPWSPHGEEPRHWLQVNNLHFLTYLDPDAE